MAKINFDNKVDSTISPLPLINKVVAADMNEIKTVVNGLDDLITDLDNNKQDTLVSGTNIKTINGQSVLGSGDLVVSGTDTNILNTNGLVLGGNYTHDFDGNTLTFTTGFGSLVIDGSGAASQDLLTVNGNDGGTTNFNKSAGIEISSRFDHHLSVVDTIFGWNEFFNISTGLGGFWKAASLELGGNPTLTGMKITNARDYEFNNNANLRDVFFDLDLGTKQVLLLEQGFTRLNSSVVIGGNAAIFNEQVSIQGKTAIQGEDTFSFNSAFVVYDGDVTPSVLLEVMNNGDVLVYGKLNLFPKLIADLSLPFDGDIFYVLDTDATFTTTGFWAYEDGAYKKVLTEDTIPLFFKTTGTFTGSAQTQLDCTATTGGGIPTPSNITKIVSATLHGTTHSSSAAVDVSIKVYWTLADAGSARVAGGGTLIMDEIIKSYPGATGPTFDLVSSIEDSVDVPANSMLWVDIAANNGFISIGNPSMILSILKS